MSTPSRSCAWVLRLALLAALAPFSRAAGPGQAPELPRTPGGDEPEVAYDEEGSPIEVGPTGVSLWGVTVRPSLNYRGFWTDNLFVNIGPNLDPESDFVHYVSPGLSVAREWPGDTRSITFAASYVPTWVIHSTKGEYDRDYHTVNGRLGLRLGEHNLGLGHTFSDTSEAATQIGVLAPQTINRTELTYGTPLTGKMALSATASQNLIDTDPTALTQSLKLRQWQGTAFVDYDALTKTTVGLGGGGGYNQQDFSGRSLDLANEQILARVRYVATGKIIASLRGGVQFNQALTEGYLDPDPAPIFGASVNYQPRFGTGVALSADRTVAAAQFFGGQFAEQTIVSLGVTQRVYQTMSLAVRGGYSLGTFENLDPRLLNFSRDFTAWLASVRFNWNPARLDWLSGGLFYQFQDRNSDLPQDTFTNHQVGLTVDLRW